MDQQEFDCKFQAIICEREGYVAENEQRKHAGSSMAYCSDDFSAKAEKFQELYRQFQRNKVTN